MLKSRLVAYPGTACVISLPMAWFVPSALVAAHILPGSRKCQELRAPMLEVRV